MWVQYHLPDRDRRNRNGAPDMNTTTDIWCGIDVGKSEHHACALDANGKKVFDKALPQDEQKLRELFSQLQQHGNVLVVVDQPNTIGALPLAVAQAVGCSLSYLPGLAMRRAAQLLPGNEKTDARDAYVIALTAQKMPDTLRAIDHSDETFATLKALAGFDEDITKDRTRSINRLRSLLLQIFPAPERVFVGTRLTNLLSLDLLIEFGGPTQLRAVGEAAIREWAHDTKHRKADKLISDVFAALSEQTVTVTGTAAIERIIPRVALHIQQLSQQRVETAHDVEALSEGSPLCAVLLSMPGVGIKTAEIIILTAGDMSTFPDAAHLASYAGIAPVTRQSGTSIHSTHQNRAGNKPLKNALFRSAFVAAYCDPESAEYYQRKIAQGKKHNAAIMCLARRRCDVIYAMVRTGCLYEPRHPSPTKQQQVSPTKGTVLRPEARLAA